MARPHVLIAGAGIGGLTAALALLKRGIDVDVYEQAHELREIGAGLQLSANGNRVLYALGVGDELTAAGVRSDRQGSAALEQRTDLEALRPRRGLGGALRLPVLHRVPPRPARDPRAGRAAREAGRHPSRRALHRLHPGRRPRDPALRRGRGRGRRAGRRRRRALADPAGALRRGLTGVHRPRRLARHDPDVAPPRSHAAAGRHQLDRPRRARRALPGARRRVHELRRHRRARRLAGRVVDRAGHGRRVRAGFPRLAPGRPRHDRQHRRAVQVGADGPPADGRGGRSAESRCSATPAIRPCRCSPRAR